MDAVDCVIVGAGVVGLAIARAVAQAGREVLVLEAAEGIGTETSSRNSEVIHAGIYYKAGSLMARHCVAGRRMLYEYCRERGVAFDNCGKLIVATDDEEADRLTAIKTRAEVNGVEGMRLLTAAEACGMEPALACTAALFSPSTGIIDSHGYMLALQGEAEAAGALFVFHSQVLGGAVTDAGIVLQVGGAEEPYGAALPQADQRRRAARAGTVRQHCRHPQPDHSHRLLRQRQLFYLDRTQPVFKVDLPCTRTGWIGGAFDHRPRRAGAVWPDVEWVDRIDYRVDPRRAEGFYAAIRRYWPDLPDGALQPGYAGIRPKIVPPAIASQDFVIQDAHVHGVPGC